MLWMESGIIEWIMVIMKNRMGPRIYKEVMFAIGMNIVAKGGSKSG